MKVWVYENENKGIRVFKEKTGALKAAIKDYCNIGIPDLIDGAEHLNILEDNVGKIIGKDLLSLIEDDHIEDFCYLEEIEVEEDA